VIGIYGLLTISLSNFHIPECSETSSKIPAILMLDEMVLNEYCFFCLAGTYIFVMYAEHNKYLILIDNTFDIYYSFIIHNESRKFKKARQSLLLISI
jgi:hypothetical protein